MSCEVATLGEPLVTVLVTADVWLLSSVGSVMCPQIEVQRELLTSYVTSEWLFTLDK